MRRVLLFGMFFLLHGCAMATDPGSDSGWRRVVGTVDIGTDGPPPLQAPAQVRAGESFPVTVTTYGSSSCTRPDGAEVKREGMRVDITPFDRIAPDGSICTTDLRAFPRTVTVRFDTAGEATVRLIGEPNGATFQARVTVLP